MQQFFLPLHIFEIQKLAKTSRNNEIMQLYKQEAHGPHRSPEKTVQINKHV